MTPSRFLPRLLGVALLLSGTAEAQTQNLSAYSIDPSTVTISGISSGGFMAVQMDVAFSSEIHGAAIFAGGPYYCAQDSETNALGDCESGSSVSVSAAVAYASAQSDAGTIDPVSNLASAPVYLFSGTSDTVVHQPVMNALQQFYQAFSVSNLTYNNSTAAGHSWVSPDGPNSCSAQQSPYINNCSIDPEQTFLTQFYGTLTAKNTGTLGGSFIQFSQDPFCSGGSCSGISLDSTGWLFVPAACASGAACRLVVVLHGCEQYQGTIGEDLVKESGVDEWADTNNIVVLYPQATTSVSNPDGCWDWWGYTSANYALKAGPQMQALIGMIHQLTGQGSPTTSTTTGTASSSGTSGGSTTSGGVCKTLGEACDSASPCCSGTSCEFGLCLLSLTSSTTTGGASGANSTTSVAASGSTAGSGSASGSTGGSPVTATTGAAGTSGSSGGAGTASSISTASSTSSSSGSAGASSGGCATGGGSADQLVPILVLSLLLVPRRKRSLSP